MSDEALLKPESDGRIITFYSYKGGTGRSMAMANVSWVLALSGYRVLVIDWDLEAPGLHRYFRPFLDDPDLAESEGLIDFAMHFVEAASERTGKPVDPDWYKPHSNLLRYVKEVNYDFPAGGLLDFIPAGQQSKAYSVRVNSFNWKHFWEKLNGELVLAEASRVLRLEYDYILIDSRTGVSDTAGICTVELPDDLVVAFTLNLQSVIGASGAAASVIEQRAQKGKTIRVFPYPMRVDFNEKIKTETMRAFAKPRFVKLLPEGMTEEEKDVYWAKSDVPYIPFYAFEENLAYFRDELNSENSVLSAMIRIAGRLTKLPIGELPKIDPDTKVRVIAEYDAFSGARALAVQPPAKVAVYLCADSESVAAGLRAEIEKSGWDILTRERFEKTRPAVFLIAVGAAGLTSRQAAELVLAEKLKNGAIYTVLVSGAQPENLPRLLLPYPVIDRRSGGAFAIPNPGSGQRLEPLGVTPYPGLNPFSVTDGPVFIARGTLTARLAEAVTRTNLVALIGPPHSGKTSLVQAGLIPRLLELDPPNPVWEVRFTWPAVPSTAPRVLVVLNARGYIVGGLVTEVPENTCLLLIAETSEQVGFCERKLRMQAERIEVPPLSDAGLMAAITEPAAQAGLTVETSLAARLVEELRNEQAPLPLLQYVMSELYSSDPVGVLNIEKYERLGGPGMVERRCETALGGRDPGALSRLVLVAEDGAMVVRPAPAASLRQEDLPAIETLVSARILVREADVVRFGDRIFLDRWPRIRQWVDQNRDFLLFRQRLDQSVAAWQANPRPFTLLSGDSLSEARKQAEDRRGDLNERELAFIEASVKAAEDDREYQSQKMKRERWRRLLFTAGIVAALVLAAVYLYISQSSQHSAVAPVNVILFEPVASPARDQLTQALRQSGFTVSIQASGVSVPDAHNIWYTPDLTEAQWRSVFKLVPGAAQAFALGIGTRTIDIGPLSDAPAVVQSVTNQAFPGQGWCYQEVGTAKTESLGGAQKLQHDLYGAYCYPLQAACQKYTPGLPTATECRLVQPMDVHTWGEVMPQPSGIGGSWFRINLGTPLEALPQLPGWPKPRKKN